jgi:hypothetical protein
MGMNELLNNSKCTRQKKFKCHDKPSENVKKPSIHKGRKVFPWYHPDFRSLAALGGPEGTRTPDLLHAMEALYQLRYKPISKCLLDKATDQNLLLSIRDNGRSDKCYWAFHTYCSQVSSVLNCSLAPTGCSLFQEDLLLLLIAFLFYDCSPHICYEQYI